MGPGNESLLMQLFYPFPAILLLVHLVTSARTGSIEHLGGQGGLRGGMGHWLVWGGTGVVHMQQGGVLSIDSLAVVAWCGRGLTLPWNLFWGAQALMEHWRFPKAVSEDPMSWWARDPSGSSKVKTTEKTYPLVNELWLWTHDGSC